METPSAPQHLDRFERAIRRFDEENAKDPHLLTQGDETGPRELIYARWLTEWVLRIEPQASEGLRLAARAAHLCRWTIARDAYPLTRAGYLRWRQDLKAFHAEKAASVLQEVGYDSATVAHVQALISKAAFPADPESRVLEDALCLVFLERQFADLASRSPEEKIVNALQKTWKKMTPQAREAAKQLTYSEKEKVLLEKAHLE
ncbi:MAG TPA: DUF4202 domain-containing protein [Verrucomicrobiae bacterium]|jgi:hypothetical protein|nr:DUF4202 domain-containing protein [Verrucomicrobiae bacterium]